MNKEYYLGTRLTIFEFLVDLFVHMADMSSLDSNTSPGLLVMGGDSCPKVVGSNPSTVYWMDIFHIYSL